MLTEIKGMIYTRKPAAGETVRVRGREGAFIIAEVFAGDERIAFDQVPESDDLKRRKAQRLKRIGLARAALTHWRREGFDVVDDVIIFP